MIFGRQQPARKFRINNIKCLYEFRHFNEANPSPHSPTRLYYLPNRKGQETNEVEAVARIERNRGVILHILMTLVSLAAIAQRAVGSPAPLRLLLIGILYPAEIMIRQYVRRMAYQIGAPMPLDFEAASKGSDAEAVRLAYSLMELAETLAYIMEWVQSFWQRLRPFGFETQSLSVSKPRAAGANRPHLAYYRPTAPDTS